MKPCGCVVTFVVAVCGPKGTQQTCGASNLHLRPHTDKRMTARFLTPERKQEVARVAQGSKAHKAEKGLCRQ